MELASFLAHTSADTHRFSVNRDSQHCTNPITGTDGKVYCSPCKEEHYDKETKTCSTPWIVPGANYEDFCDTTRTGEQGCNCKNVTMVSIMYLICLIDC